MVGTTFTFSGILVLFGILLWAVTGFDEAAKTSLIPSAVGIVLLVLGAIAIKKSLRPHAMHLALGLALLLGLAGIGMSFSGFANKGLSPAPIGQLGMGVILLVFVGFGVRSFIAARKARKLEA